MSKEERVKRRIGEGRRGGWMIRSCSDFDFFVVLGAVWEGVRLYDVI